MSEQQARDADEIRDELPDDLNPAGFVGAYMFPDNSRRRWPGGIYLALAAVCVIVYVVFPDAAIVNGGWILAAVVLAAAGLFSITSGWRMNVDEKEALVAAQQAAGFAVGHASAQQVWRGLRSRPTWRVLCYSAEEPPLQRALVLVDAVDSSVVEHLVEQNPEARPDVPEVSQVSDVPGETLRPELDTRIESAADVPSPPVSSGSRSDDARRGAE